MSSSSSPTRSQGERPRTFDGEAKRICWAKAETVPGRHPERWRKDSAGNILCKRLFNCQGCLCFEYDHIIPFSKGGESIAENCQILQTRVNRLKSNKDEIDISRLKSYSCDIKFTENVILAFQGFERNHYGAVTIQAFTAISPRNLMHEDICTLALDVLASIIILPFHRKWAVDGSVEVEDHGLRTLNSSVLERAPCSVAILVDRGQLKRSTSVRASENVYCIAILFLGGNDDQEALAFAKRMAISGTISLTVIRLISKQDVSCDVDEVIDLDIVGDWKQSRSSWENVKYIEHYVHETTETALLVRSLVDDYDLIITGRRNNTHSPLTAGLEEWTEIPELGVIGDMLASKDLKTRASVLVIQQQQTTL